MRVRLLVLTVTLLPVACVLKSKHDDTMADNLRLGSQVSNISKELEICKKNSESQQKRLSEYEMRNEELANTNQLLASKNSNCTNDLLSMQDQILREKKEKAKVAERVQYITQTYDDLVKALKDEIQEGQVMIAKQGDRLSVNVADQVLFSSGSAKIQTGGKRVLEKVVPILKKLINKRIEVEGHTDNKKIRGTLKKRFETNWELSTARSTQVVRFFISRGLDAKKIAAVGYAENRPVASNRTAAGRRKNRRIEIVLLPIVPIPSP